MNNEYYNYYTIQSGDTLSGIAREFDVNVNLLAELNGLELDDFIHPNQNIRVPRKDVEYYITKEDDTLKSISNVFGVTQEEIIKKNEGIYLLPGQMIYYKR